MQPISNAIHRLEGDHPTLSQVMRIWDDLVEHAKNWAASRGDMGGEERVDAGFVRGVHKLFKNRAAKHYQPVMAAARLLDPINFKYLNHVDQPYPDFDILTEMQR
ncbi:dimer_Tnp_hAT domain-containing protein, partial [Haematococcus lacustris]